MRHQNLILVVRKTVQVKSLHRLEKKTVVVVKIGILKKTITKLKG